MPDTLADDAFGLGASGAATAYFVVSVSGLTTNSTYGQTAQIGTPLYASAHHFSEAAPASVAWKWNDNTGEIAGATSASYTPVPGDNLENIYPTATPLGPYMPQDGPAHTVRFAAPVSTGGLPDVSYSIDTGDSTVATAGGFIGEDLTYSVSTTVPGVIIDRDTGVVSIETGNGIQSGTVAVTVESSGGVAHNQFDVSIVGAGFSVTLTGLMGEIAQIGTTLSAEVNWLLPTGTVTGYQWNRDGQIIPGAIGQTYLVDPSVDGADLSCTVTTIEYGSANSSVHRALYAAPVAVGSLPNQAYAMGSGDQIVDAAAGFAGSGITYSVNTPIAGVTIDGTTGIVTIRTGSEVSGSIAITAANSGGSAQISFDVSITSAATAPAKMSRPTVTSSGPTSLRVDMGNVPDDGGSPITSYDLRWREEGGVYVNIIGASNPETLTGLITGAVYQIRTRALNAVGRGQWSPVAYGSPEEITSPVGLPDIVANSDDTVDIMVDEGEFTVTVSGSDNVHHNGAHGPFTASDLDNGPISAVAPVTSGVAGVGQTLAALSGLWIHEAGDTPTIAGKWRRNGVDIPSATGSTYVVNEADGGETITYVETATNAAGSRTRASSGMAIPVATVPEQMAAPTVTAAGSDGIDVVLAAAPNDGGSAITSYDLRWQADGGAWVIAMDIGNPHVVSGLTAATIHHVQTRAVSALGHGAWSASGTATTAEAGAGLLFTDTFDYVDGTLLTSRPEWSDQYSLGGAIETRSGNAQLVSGGTQWLKCGEALATDQFAEVVITEPPAAGGQAVALYVRQTGPTSYYGIRCTAGSVSLVREGPSGYTALWIGPAVEAGDRVRIEAEGTIIRYVLNGIVAQAVTDSDVTDGAAAFIMSGSAKIGQFSCGEL